MIVDICEVTGPTCKQNAAGAFLVITMGIVSTFKAFCIGADSREQPISRRAEEEASGRDREVQQGRANEIQRGKNLGLSTISLLSISPKLATLHVLLITDLATLAYLGVPLFSPSHYLLLQRCTTMPPELANQPEIILDKNNLEEVGEQRQTLQVCDHAFSSNYM
jgi:hypothetical protein